MQPGDSGSDGRRPRSRIAVGRPLREAWDVLRQAVVEWWNDDSFQLAAALAFYTLFSLAPLIVIALGVAGRVFGEETAIRELVSQVNQLIGSSGGAAVRAVIENAEVSRGGPLATLLGVVMLAIGASAVFAQLQTALNRIWDVKAAPDQSSIPALVRARLIGLALSIGTGFLLIVSLVVSAVISATRAVVSSGLPDLQGLWLAAEVAGSYLIVTGLFMTVYKVLPDARIAWRDAIVGALMSSALFTIGKSAIGLYLGRMSIGDVYGAAGSLVVLLVWVYYTALVSFFGAELTQVYARRYGSPIRPSKWARRRGEGEVPGRGFPHGS